MKKKILCRGFWVCLIIVSFGLVICGCSCGNNNNKKKEVYYDVAANINKFSKVNPDYIKSTGLFIDNCEIQLPIIVEDLPINANGEFYYQRSDTDLISYNDKIRPYESFFFCASKVFPEYESRSKGTYYAYNNSNKDNLAKYCLIYCVEIYTRYLIDNEFIQIGNDRITNETSYEEICNIFRNNVTSAEYYIENNYDDKKSGFVAQYNDVLYEVSKDYNGILITIRVDKDISDWKN